MTLGTRVTAALAAAAFGTVLMTGTADAATTQTVCGTTTTPQGWVETRYWDSTQCGGTGALYNTKEITDTSAVTPGGAAEACTYSPIPTGFWITKYWTVSTCYRGNGTSDYHNHQQLVNLNNEPPGATTTICGLLTVPSGWTVVSRTQSMDCEQHIGSLPANDNTMTIRKS